ncbi:RNA polymerase sigma-70 factor (family 1) [Pedobacter africanus]|uniref:RNA polymerase sigma-70 factor (ECF subfamily) n=1 Tax=Pedobacter africanus TaxID=151894 RepID=A0ACC6KXZ6_9SPHI|nr:RNA polymerase sigma-70 factor [Pedobacter africanus]MDR6784106.1 RNA polymerase sigma-70 factor (ECF subfamily) [Pedobacter africanus]
MHSLSNLDDFELMTLLKADQELAFAEIFRRFDSLLYIYAYKKLQNTEEAKDVVQEVFVQLWNARKDFVLKTTLPGYLYKSVLNKILNIIARKQSETKYIASLQHAINSDMVSADFLIREKDITALIEKEIAALPPKMREVFELRKNQYLSNKEIALQLNISEQTVETHMKRALKILRNKLGVLIYLCYLL